MISNEQPVEKVRRTADSILHVHSIFYTIQGEGPFSGKPALFIRLAGCNLCCPLCDTEYTDSRVAYHASELVAKVKSTTAPEDLVVITGGEPFRQPQALGVFLDELVDIGYYVQVETNGTLPPPVTSYGYRTQVTDRPYGVYIVCSPKTGKVHPEIIDRACCFKYVLTHTDQDSSTGLPLYALRHTANPYLARPPVWWDRPIYMQPADHQDPIVNQKNQDAAVKACMEHGYTLQLQIHKLLGVQ